MSAVFGLDLLFSRKGEATPAVQTGVPLTRPNRFEALARTLGQQDVTPARRDGADDAEPARWPAASQAEPQTHRASVTPFARLRAAPVDGSKRLEAAPAADDVRVQGGSSQTFDAGMIVRRAPAEETAVRPWQKVRSGAAKVEPAPRTETTPERPQERRPPPWIALGDGGRTGASSHGSAPDTLEDTGELEVFLFGPDGQSADGPGESNAGTSEAGTRPRRRQVSVRLPAREHALLRQFAKVWGTTQQSVVRRAILLHMIEELKQRLDETPRETPVDGAFEGCD
ncbi:hypothetical protein [uncultured Rhodospira sp.]|uniref:hypothetical protein n=1 Tax=uncultured Rhodospira sp. TaxID=1936189 RepID=UPI002629D39C|nr:hypothetical protein [uncultured Rhodospira sp.]